ncbi:MAG: helix-turn-helix domain-containing protein [Pseudomonadota bacterium]
MELSFTVGMDRELGEGCRSVASELQRPVRRTDGSSLGTSLCSSAVPFTKISAVSKKRNAKDAVVCGGSGGLTDGPGLGSRTEDASCRTHETDFRTAATQLCLRTVSLALCVPLKQLEAANRCKADIALARQIAMYLAHTQFSMAMTEVGLAFGRDRTTVSHACSLVEDKRDEETFDLTITQLEALLGEAVNAIEARCQQVEGVRDVFQG